MKKNHNLRILAKFGVVMASISVMILVGCGGGGGTSSPPTPILPRLISASAIVDVNGDGKNDIILGSHGDGYSSPLVLINGGNGSSFIKKTTAIPTQYLGVNGAAVDIQPGDFNNDGKIDLLVITVDVSQSSFYQTCMIQLYLGNGDGTFVDASANINGGSWNQWLASVFGFGGPVSGSWVEFVRVADFDGDGFLDFITTSISIYGGTVYRNDGTGKFSPVSLSTGYLRSSYFINPTGARDIIVGDINNDGKPDLVSYEDRTSYINTSTPGTISFTSHPGLPARTLVFLQGGLVDINGDGFLDVIEYEIGTSLGPVPVRAFINDGTGTFLLDNTVFLPTQPTVDGARQFLAADLNGDGKQDVLISNSGTDLPPYAGAPNLLLINNGAGKLANLTSSNLDIIASFTHQSAIGDLNADGKPDLLLNNKDGNTEPRFWLNNGLGKFTSFNPSIQ